MIWQTANPLGNGGYAATGWMGRFLADASQMYSGSDIPAVNIDDSVVGEYRQSQTSVLALRRLRDFGFPYDDYSSFDVQPPSAARSRRCIRPPPGRRSRPSRTSATPASRPCSAARAIRCSTVSTRPTARPTASCTTTSARSVSRDLREVAKVIYGVATGQPNVNARFFQLSNGGYDTHSDQGGATGQHHDLHKEVGDSRPGVLRGPRRHARQRRRQDRASWCGASSAAASIRTAAAPTTARRGRCS